MDGPLTADTALFWSIESVLTNLESCNFLRGRYMKGLVGPPSLDCGQAATAFVNMPPA